MACFLIGLVTSIRSGQPAAKRAFSVKLSLIGGTGRSMAALHGALLAACCSYRWKAPITAAPVVPAGSQQLSDAKGLFRHNKTKLT